MLVLACGRPDDGHGASLAANGEAMDEGEPAASGPTGDDRTNDAGAPPTDGDSFGCPAPRPEAAPGDTSGWARDPATGDCCPYANRNAAPDGWPGVDLELECRCSIESCPSSLDEAERSLCAVTSPPANVQGFVGCGLVAVADYARYEWVFEQPGSSTTPATRLVGAAKFSNAGSMDAGSTPTWSAGISVAQCDYGPALDCQLCGDDPTSEFPPCQ